MTTWKDFLQLLEISEDNKKPGKIMIRFVNRYNEAADGVEYSIKYEGKEIKGIITNKENTVVIQPKTTNEILVYAWSKKRGTYKLIEKITPIIDKPQLVLETMKTYKQHAQTQPHPSGKNNSTPATQLPQRQPAAAGPSPTTDQGVNPKHEVDPIGAPVQASERPLPDQITVSQLKNIFPSSSEDFLKKVADECNRDLKKYKLDTILRRAHFFAQAREEAGPALKANSEIINYAYSALSIFKYYKKNPAEAKKDGRIDDPKSTKKKPLPPLQKSNPEAIANHAYANRFGNGDFETGDGWRYRGRGIFQLTFKSNYKAFDDDYTSLWDGEKPNFVEHPENLMEFPYTIRSAIWYWVSKKIYDFADSGATDSAVSDVTSKINPPLHHLAERQKNFHNLTYPAFK